MNDSISFKSKIKFINYRDFYKNHNKGLYIGFTHKEPNVLKADKFYTEAIRTCTGGGLVSPQKGCLGFHIWDDKINKKNFEKIAISMIRFLKSPERGLLIGSKDLKGNIYSIEQFNRFKDFLSKRVSNLTVFEKHTYSSSESNIAYSLEDDTWLIATTFFDTKINKYQKVDSLSKLRKAFEKIKITDGDELYIGEKRILPSDAPEMFY